MKFYNEDDMTEENFNKFLQEVEELEKKCAENNRLLSENAPKHFNSVEEFMKYHNAIPLEEWEKSIFEKYGL